MNPDSLQKLIRLAQDAAGVTITNIEGDPRHQLLSSVTIGCRFLDIPPPPRNHVVHDLESLMAAVLIANNSGCGKSIWHDDWAVVLLVNDEDRRDRVTLPLVHAAQFDALVQLANVRDFSHTDLIRFLRLKVAAYGMEAVVSILRKLDLSRKSTGAASVDATVTATRDIPDRFTVTVPVYNNPDCDRGYAVEMLLEIDAQTERFYLTPAPDELENAIHEAQGEIDSMILADERVKAGNVAVYYGSPDPQ